MEAGLEWVHRFIQPPAREVIAERVGDRDPKRPLLPDVVLCMQEAVLHRPAPFNNDAHEWDRALTDPAEQPVDGLSDHPGLVPVHKRIPGMIVQPDLTGLAPPQA